jgi:hypothetical protein
VKILAWFSLSFIVLGLLIATSPYLLILIIGEDSEEVDALGWVFLFFALPIGVLLMTTAVVLILIAGIRGLANGSPRRFGILALVGAGGSTVTALALIVLIVNNLMVDYDAPTVSPIPLVLFTVALLILGLVATFLLAFSSPTRLVEGENLPAGA